MILSSLPFTPLQAVALALAAALACASVVWVHQLLSDMSERDHREQWQDEHGLNFPDDQKSPEPEFTFWRGFTGSLVLILLFIICVGVLGYV